MPLDGFDNEFVEEEYLQYLDQLAISALPAELARMAWRKVEIRRSLRFCDFRRRFRHCADAATTRVGAVAMCMMVAAGLSTVLSHLVGSSPRLILGVSIGAASSLAVLCLALLFRPDDVTLDLLIRNLGRELLQAREASQLLKARISDGGDHLPLDSAESAKFRIGLDLALWHDLEPKAGTTRSVEEGRRRTNTNPVRPGLIDGFIRAKHSVVRPDWKALSGIPFERYLAEVFYGLGYKVEITKASGDQGVDLILRKDGRCIAVQAKGYPSGNSVGNKVVQAVHTGKDFYKCDTCAVITNSIFTKGARELANGDRIRCIMIDKSKLGDVIDGRFSL